MTATGHRKTITTAMGLLALLVLAFLSTFGGLTEDGLSTLSWSIVFLTGSALGANVGEHWTKRPTSAGAASPAATPTTTPPTT